MLRGLCVLPTAFFYSAAVGAFLPVRLPIFQLPAFSGSPAALFYLLLASFFLLLSPSSSFTFPKFVLY